MKKRFLPHIFLSCMASVFAFTANATIYFDDNFDAYNDGALYNQGGWVKYGTNPDNPIQLTATNLTYDGYQSGTAGKAVQLQRSTEVYGEDLQKALTTPFIPMNLDSKTFYMSFLVNVQDTGTAAFITLCDANKTFADGSSGIQKVYVSIKEGSEGKVKFALGKSSESGTNLVVTTDEYDLNITYLIVLKYIAIPDGLSNDQIDMFVNPIITSEAANTPQCTATGGSDINDTKGIASVQLRQHKTKDTSSPTVIVDAIRIADTWNELFGSEEPPVTDQPTLNVSETKVDFGYSLFVGDQLTQTINIKAEHLTGDITLGGLSGDVVASVTTISKEDAMTEAGVDVILTLTITQVGEFAQNLTISSEDAATLTIPVTWYANPSVANIKALLDAYGGESDYNIYRIESEVVVTHVYNKNGVLVIAVQDETGAIFMEDIYGIVIGTYNVGDRLEKICGHFSELGTYYFNPTIMGAAIRNEPIEPQLVTLAELQANPLDYAVRLVRVNDVTFSTTGSFSTQQVDITQNGTTGKVGLFVNSEIIGETIPAKADIIGISRNATGKLITPRFKTDIIAKNAPTGIYPSTVADNVWTDNGTLYLNLQENATVHIYNVQGKQVYGGNMVAGLNSLSLEQGIYLIKMNENTTKILIK